MNDNAKAIKHYEKFLDLWKDADPGIPSVLLIKQIQRMEGNHEIIKKSLIPFYIDSIYIYRFV